MSISAAAADIAAFANAEQARLDAAVEEVKDRLLRELRRRPLQETECDSPFARVSILYSRTIDIKVGNSGTFRVEVPADTMRVGSAAIRAGMLPLACPGKTWKLGKLRLDYEGSVADIVGLPGDTEHHDEPWHPYVWLGDLITAHRQATDYRQKQTWHRLVELA